MDIKLPFLGDNIAQGTVTKLLVKVGDTIKKDQNIVELETDKAVMEVPSSTAGVVSEILIKSGDVVTPNQLILKLAGSDAAPAASAPKTPVAENKPAPAAAASTPAPAAAPVATSGAIVDFKLPALGENILKGTVTKILVKAGDVVKKGQGILEIETDKAVLEVPSPNDITIKEVLIKAGSVVEVGAPVFKVQAGAVAVASASAAPASPASTPAKQPVAAPTTTTTPVVNSSEPLPVRTNVPAAPSVRLFAREIGIDIAQVPGSGRGGRISIEDVKKFAKALNTSRPQGGAAAPVQQPLPDFSKWGQTKREPMNNVRKKTAEHLSYAWNSIPHVTQFDKADVTEVEKLRKAISTPEKKISVTPFIIKALALALKQFPQFNTSVDMSKNEIVYKDYVNIGVAVDTERGLIVPVLKNVDAMSIMEINDALVAIAQRARDRKTTLDEMQGGCFTLSNLGGIGGTFFTPIVNTPEVAILGVSRGAMEPIYIDGQFVPRLMLPLSLSYDHRVIDGADGARFIRWVIGLIEKPAELNK